MRKDPPKVGTRITYIYYGLTDDGKPRFPVFDRVREEY
jgi:DNA ligase-1